MMKKFNSTIALCLVPVMVGCGNFKNHTLSQPNGKVEWAAGIAAAFSIFTFASVSSPPTALETQAALYGMNINDVLYSPGGQERLAERIRKSEGFDPNAKIKVAVAQSSAANKGTAVQILNTSKQGGHVAEISANGTNALTWTSFLRAVNITKDGSLVPKDPNNPLRIISHKDANIYSGIISSQLTEESTFSFKLENGTNISITTSGSKSTRVIKNAKAKTVVPVDSIDCPVTATAMCGLWTDIKIQKGDVTIARSYYASFGTLQRFLDGNQDQLLLGLAIEDVNADVENIHSAKTSLTLAEGLEAVTKNYNQTLEKRSAQLLATFLLLSAAGAMALKYSAHLAKIYGTKTRSFAQDFLSTAEGQKMIDNFEREILLYGSLDRSRPIVAVLELLLNMPLSKNTKKVLAEKREQKAAREIVEKKLAEEVSKELQAMQQKVTMLEQVTESVEAKE